MSPISAMRPGDPDFNPFPGLRPFQVEEEYLFFGREAQRQELISLLKTHRFVAVLGASGSGKSSLVRAGLLPALFGGVMVGAGSHWNIGILRPGGSPIRNLAEALRETEIWADREPPAVLEIETTLSRSGLGLIETIRQARLPASQNVLIVVDQFEELFRFSQSQSERSTRDEASAFVRLLLEATRQDQHAIYVVLTMRSDFFGDCAQFDELPEAINKGEYLVPRLNRDQKKQAIEGPIKVGGTTIAPRLLQRLLNDVGDDPDQLPILQHALMRTWEQWGRRKNESCETPLTRPAGTLSPLDGERVGVRGTPPLDLEDYESIGGMREALSRHADEVFAGLPDDRHRVVAEKISKALTERGPDNRGIRRPTRLGQLCAIAGATEIEAHAVAEAFRKRGCTFLMPPEPTPLTPETVIDISHESLMRVWQRLRRWVEEEAQSARVYHRLADTAALHTEGKAGLYHDPDLQIALTWRDTEQPTPAWAERYHPGFDPAMAFLDQSAVAERAEEEAREAVRRRELEQAKALAETERQRAEEQVRFAARLKWLVRGLGLVAMVALTAMLLAIAARKQAQDNAELAQRNEARATEQARIAQQEKERADGQAEQLRRQVYRSQLLRATTALRQSNGGAIVMALQDCDASLRHWEWNRLSYLADQSLRTIRAFTNANAALTTVQFSPDGRHLLTSSVLGGVKVLDAVNGRAVWELPEQSRGIYDVPATYSPDGKRIAVRNKTSVEIWDVSDMRTIQEFGHSEGFRQLSFSSDGRILLVPYWDKTVKLWDAASGKELKTLIGHNNAVQTASISSDGKMVASAGFDGTARIWDGQTGKPLCVIPAQFVYGIWSVVFSPDGRRIVAGLGAGSVKVYESPTGKELKEVDNRFRAVRSVAFSPDGSLLAAAGGTLMKLWNAENYEELAEFMGHENDIQSIAFDPNGRTIVSGDREGIIKLWPTSKSPNVVSLRGHRGDLREVAFRPDGKRLVTSGSDGTLRVWDVTTGEELLTLKDHKGIAPAVDYSPDGNQIVSGGQDRAVRLWDARTGRMIRVLRGHTDMVWWVDFSPDGTLIVSGGPDKAARIWDARTGRLMRTLATNQFNIEGASFSPDGKLIATCEGGESGQVKIWEVNSGQILKTLTGPRAYNRCVVFSPDGKSVAAGAYNASALIWDLASGNLLTLKVSSGTVRSVAFSPDGKRLFGGGDAGLISVWDATSGEEIVNFEGNQGGIWSIKVSPDGKTLASSGLQGVIQLWETERVSEEIELRRRLVNAAQRVVDEKSQAGMLAADLLASIRQDTSLDDRVREMALQIAEARGDIPSRLLPAIEPVLRNPNSDEKALSLALRQMESVAATLVDDVAAQWMLGFARFRAGQFVEALQAAERANELSQQQTQAGDAGALLVKSLAQFRLGRTDEAKASYAQAKPLLPMNLDANPDLRAVAELAKQLIE